MPTFYGTIPKAENLKQNDVILFNDVQNFQTPEIQNLFKQGFLGSYIDPKTGSATGVQMIKNYTTPGNLPQTVLPNAEDIKKDLLTTQGKYQSTDTSGNAYWTDVNPAGNADATSLSTTDGRTAILDEAGKQRAILKQGLENQYSQIEQATGEAIQGQKDISGRSTGTMRRILAKGGGISGTAAGMALANQENVLATQISSLEKKKQELKNSAYQSYLEGDLQVEKDTRKEIQDLEKSINDTNQQRLDNLLKIYNFQNTQRQMDISTLNALNNMPEGKSIEINGTVYQGLKKIDSKTSLVKDTTNGSSLLINMDDGSVIAEILNTGKTAEQEMVLDLWNKYPDSGILPEDTLSQATAKLRNSSIYNKSIKSSSSESSSTDGLKFTQDEKNTIRSYGLNFASPEVQNVFINALTPSQRQKWQSDFLKQESAGNMSLDKGASFINWYTEKAKKGELVNSGFDALLGNLLNTSTINPYTNQ